MLEEQDRNLKELEVIIGEGLFDEKKKKLVYLYIFFMCSWIYFNNNVVNVKKKIIISWEKLRKLIGIYWWRIFLNF